MLGGHTHFGLGQQIRLNFFRRQVKGAVGIDEISLTTVALLQDRLILLDAIVHGGQGVTHAIYLSFAQFCPWARRLSGCWQKLEGGCLHLSGPGTPS